jgi:glycosyltransferase involved in cell wall biosynthesis
MDTLSQSVSVVIPAKDPGSVLDDSLGSIYNQRIPKGWTLVVLVVDDGSETPISVDERHSNGIGVSIFHSKDNEGRAQAINRGLKLSSSEYVWILDADCILDSDGHFERVVSCFKKGFDFCVGRTIASGDDFWSHYHNEVASDRADMNEYSGYTTACFAANRNKLLEVGGFNSEYQHYGFEDKDLVATIVNVFGETSLYHDPKLAALHEDRPILRNVASKFNQAGRFSAPIFFARHENLYKTLAYSSYDPRMISSGRTLFLRSIAPFVRSFLVVAPYCLANRIVPYKLKKMIVQSLCAIAYFTGGQDLEWPKS